MSVLDRLDWKKISETDEFYLKSKTKKVKLEVIARSLYGLFFKKPNLDKCEKINTDFLFFKSMKRNDYDWLFNEIISTCHSDYKKIIDIKYTNVSSIRYYPFMLIFKYLLLYRKAFRSSLLDTFFLMIRMTYYFELYEKIKYYKSKYLVVFADMQPIDNMLVQIARKQDVLTITMQHGLYIDYKDYVTVNSVNYLHAVANIFLAWGDETAELIKKYHPESATVIVGKPIEPQKIKEKQKYFTVVFDSNYFYEHNLELLEIAYEICDTLKLKVNLKLHPNNEVELFNINKGVTLIGDEIMSSIFVLGHTTTMLYECMNSGIPSLRYKTDKPSNKILSKLEFCDVTECLSILNNHEVMSLDYRAISRYYFKYVSIESKNQYTNFFNTLL